ncbi:hypothetical protein BJD99_02955 [Rhodococcus sp. 1163]|uniref:hypothetical protein n=1 Tax=unclassified Rhodococcus (in: high G+C Gram-positive bacteria) TaxID=192944 RepID=UPI0009FBA654|nr:MULTISPECIES: hypothetical protein [unclassified Rhodococcus (in: high G+C Gram-positive bacteria)]ORI20441.1 hypothetical protein BJD99_02955 [Rhodococcus sp. 1163]QCB49687.1 hypothetical protein E5769_05055 [Rhodococcus sp. PAMC28705]QCB58621.1 hypothetical protein E5720_08960 [Rhodococcus sp. PAMC28707]
MTLALVATLAVAAAVGTVRFGFRSPVIRTATHLDGPGTLEELFAARYARGDIDLLQYRTLLDHVAMQLRG